MKTQFSLHLHWKFSSKISFDTTVREKYLGLNDDVKLHGHYSISSRLTISIRDRIDCFSNEVKDYISPFLWIGEVSTRSEFTDLWFR